MIRSLLAVSDLGTRFDVNLLRNRANVNIVKENFPRCCDAIRKGLEFVQNECWISNGRLLNGYNNLIPFIYYRFHVSDGQIPGGEINRLRKAVYLFEFSSLFSRYSDQRLGTFIREVLKPAGGEGNKKFPLEESLWWVWHWERLENYGPELIQRNPLLALYLVRHGSGDRLQYENSVPKTGHVFSRSELRELGYNETDVNHFANLWIFPGYMSTNKSNKSLIEFLDDVKDSELKKAFIDRSLLDYRHYKAFLKEREAKILTQVKKKLKLSDSDFDVSKYRKIDRT